jgi:hypothetical protein
MGIFRKLAPGGFSKRWLMRWKDGKSSTFYIFAFLSLLYSSSFFIPEKTGLCSLAKGFVGL